jgi:hypothetical protein
MTVQAPVETQSPRERGWVYITACVLLVALVIGGLIAFTGAVQTAQAQEKADELVAALEQAGAPTPDRDRIIRVLGDDGGATCHDPNSALKRSTMFSMLTNGAAGPGIRPVIADSRAVRGQLLIIQVYCPEELEDFQQLVDDLRTDDLTNG